MSKQRWVIKIGSALLTDLGKGLNRSGLTEWAGQLAGLHKSGKEVILVSSGAVAEGMTRLGWNKRPNALHELQAAAAVGQMGLIQAYESALQQYGLQTAQILLTHQDLSNRQRYLNTRSTLQALLKLNVIPIINENDTVATDEFRFGDNDTLAAMVANLIEADYLIILTDQDGLYDKDPRKHKDAQLIPQASSSDPKLEQYAGSSASDLSRGGMRTKITAAQIAARSGTHTIIASGHENNVIQRLAEGEQLGSLLKADRPRLTARKQWIAHQLEPQGTLQLDQGACDIISKQGKSLLSVGVMKVNGKFERGDLVICANADKQIIARGLINYSSDECRIMAGQPSNQIEALLGYINEKELIHRNNLIVF